MATMTAHFLDVGQGDGTLIEMRPEGPKSRGELVLVDLGESHTPSKVPATDAKAFLVDYITENSLARRLKQPFVDTLFLTHPDPDHYNLVVPLTQAFGGRKLQFGRIVFGGQETDYDDVITGLSNDGLVGVPPSRLGDKEHAAAARSQRGYEYVPHWKYAKGNVRVYLLSSNFPTCGPKKTGGRKKKAEQRGVNPNPMSLVLMFECGDKKLIIQGDAEREVEDEILKNFNHDFLRATALKLGHHGSQAASSTQWIAAVQPQAIFASGDMHWSHPYCAPICRVTNQRCLKPVGRSGPRESWYCCGRGGTPNREYFNQRTELAICMNLWYVVLEQQEHMEYDPKGDEMDWEPTVDDQGMTFGVQWQLDLPDQGKWEFGLTAHARPDESKRNAAPPEFDCRNVRDAFDVVSVPG